MPEKNLVKQIIFLCLALIVSWVLVHFLALFGIFLAIALPILHIIFYPSVICFWCQIRHSPHNFGHSLIDSVIVIVITVLSLSLVYGESLLLKALGLPKTSATVSFIIPTRNQYKLAEIFPMKIEITGIESPINTVQADLAFDPSKIEVVDITTEDSFANIFLQKDYDNNLGYVRMTGGIPNPGYNQKSGVLGVVYFRGKNSGLAEVKFLDSSLVLANDGRGSNVLKDLASAAYVILPESIPSDQRDQQSKVLIEKQVLGDSITDTTLRFYEYTTDLPKPQTNILGATAPSVEPPKPATFTQSSINLLAKIDAKIIQFWKKLISRR